MSDFASRASLATPLHARTAELCATNRWTEDEGFTVPAVYSSLREEQEALVTRVGLSDLSARQCWLVEGPDAGAYLSWLTITDVTRLEPGQTARTMWLDDAGFVRGDGVIVRFAAASFELRSAVRDFAWVADGARGFDVKVTNATGMRAAIGVRGPLTAALAAASGLTGEAPGGQGGAARAAWRPAQVALMRDATGDGLELWTSADDGIVVWDRLWKAGAGLGIAAVGAQALEALRVESAIARAGVDWLPAQLARSARDLRLPYDLGVGPDRSRRFNGVSALAIPAASARPVLVHLTADQPLSPGPVAIRNATVGTITSASWSEARAAAFALAWLEADAVKVGSKVTAAGLQAEILRAAFA